MYTQKFGFAVLPWYQISFLVYQEVWALAVLVPCPCVSLPVYEELCRSLHTRKRWFVVLPCMCVRIVFPCIRGSMVSPYFPGWVSLLVYAELWVHIPSLCTQCRSLHTRKYDSAVLTCMRVAPYIRGNMSFVAYEEALVRSTSLHVCTQCRSLHTRKYVFAVFLVHEAIGRSNVDDLR